MNVTGSSSKSGRRYVSRLVPSSPTAIAALITATSAVDSTLLGFDSSLMGSLNVMPTYTSYFHLTTTTRSLNTAISYLGGCCSAPIAGFITDWRGRREAIWLSCALTFVGALIQAFSVNVGMFIAGRFIVGFGLGIAATAAPTYVAETVLPKHRAFALGVYYACWGVGTLCASGICYRTQFIQNTWAWRTPSLLQIVWSIWCSAILLFVPESPRWLIGQDRHSDALEVLSVIHAGGDQNDPAVQVQYQEIADTIAFEKGEGQQLTIMQAISHPSNRKRLTLATTFSVIVMLPGTNIITYYFGTMLEQAGITSPTTQLEINIILVSWTLVISLVGAWRADKLSRKMLCSISLIGQIVTFFILAGLTKLYGTSTNTSGIYATIAMIFLYNAAYGYGITPLTVLYPPEVLSYRIRAAGMALYTFATKASGLFVTMVFPFALDAIGYKTYIINACADIIMLAGVIIYWVETRGMTLEEIDKVFDGEKHSDVPDLRDVKVGKLGSLTVTEGVPVDGTASVKGIEAEVTPRLSLGKAAGVDKTPELSA